MHIMDGQRVTKPQDTRRRHADAFKQMLIERSLVPGAPVAAIAQEAGINANLLFNWRRLHLRPRASASDQESRDPVLLPVTVVEPAPTTASAASTSAPAAPSARSPIGTIEINIRGTVVRLRGTVDEASLRTVLRALAGAA
jgi:transposase